MKNILVATLSLAMAIIVGSMFMDISYPTNEVEVLSSSRTVNVFQVGSFNDFDNASNVALEKNGVVYQNGEHYDVYIGIFKEEDNIDKMRKYLDSNNVYYYIKTIDVTDQFMYELENYEGLMKQTKSDVAFLQLNEKVLKKFIS